MRTTSGAEVVAILGGQPSVLAERALVEHALRMTLVADSLSLQFRLPPPGIAQPVARQSAAIAGGVPVVDALVLTSVWAVQVLRTLSLVSGQGLVNGVAVWEGVHSVVTCTHLQSTVVTCKLLQMFYAPQPLLLCL